MTDAAPHFLGHPTAWRRRLDLERELDAEEVRSLVRRLEALLGRPGTGEQAAGLATWVVGERGREAGRLHVEPGPRGTRVRLAVHQGEHAIAVYVGGLLAGVAAALVAAFLGFQPETAGAYGLLLVAGGLLGHLVGHAAWRSASRRWERRVDTLLDELALPPVPSPRAPAAPGG